MTPEQTSTPLIRCRDAVFGYGRREVVRVEELDVVGGRCLGVFGPNGSGKTTLVRGLTGLLAPLRGEVERQAARIGYLPQARSIDLSWPMSGFDAAAIAPSAYGRIDRARRESINAAMRRLEVDGLARTRFATLSGGQQQRLMLAGALAARPDMLVLDEPTDGLDIRSRQNLLNLLRELAGEGLALVVISHDVEELLAVADEVALIHPASQAGDIGQTDCATPAVFVERVTTARRVDAR